MACNNKKMGHLFTVIRYVRLYTDLEFWVFKTISNKIIKA